MYLAHLISFSNFTNFTRNLPCTRFKRPWYFYYKCVEVEIDIHKVCSSFFYPTLLSPSILMHLLSMGTSCLMIYDPSSDLKVYLPDNKASHMNFLCISHPAATQPFTKPCCVKAKKQIRFASFAYQAPTKISWGYLLICIMELDLKASFQ